MARPEPKHVVSYVAELAVVVGYALLYARKYITLPRSFVPSGDDYGISIYGRFFWDDVRACGTCALWNGNFAGGNPAFLDVGSDLFHPAAAIPSAIWGAMYGSRITVPIALALAGVACWWLAQVLGTGTISRLTAGLLGVTGGFITGRYEHGLVVLALSIATAAFLLPATLLIFERPDRRHAAILGFFLGLTALSGQAYIQIAVVCLLPLSGLLFLRNPNSIRTIVWRLVEAGLIAILICSVQVIPTVRWWERIQKDSDIAFARAQQFRYVPTNLVISNGDFYRTPMLDREPFPGLYSNYIGWLALGLAVLGIARLSSRNWPRAAFLGCYAVGALWLSSAQLFQWLSRWDDHPGLQNFAANIRTPSNMANIAVPAIIGLTAVGIQWLLDASRSWYRLRLHSRLREHRLVVTIDLRILVVLLALVMVRGVANEGRQWLNLEDWNGNRESTVASAVQTDELGWISDPTLNRRFQLLGPSYNLKIANIIRPWWIDDKSEPLPWAYVNADAQPDGTRAEANGDVAFWVASEGNPYARIQQPNGEFVECRATGRGGDIRVRCPEGVAGELVVQERAFPGWSATVDGSAMATKTDGTWLEVPLPTGGSDVRLTFQPRYFWWGLALTCVGLVWALWWICFPNLASQHRSWGGWRSHVPV